MISSSKSEMRSANIDGHFGIEFGKKVPHEAARNEHRYGQESDVALGINCACKVRQIELGVIPVVLVPYGPNTPFLGYMLHSRTKNVTVSVS